MRTINIDGYEPQAVILCSGDYPTHPMPLSLLQNCPRVVCCDSAAFGFVRQGGAPWRIVGDCDSILAPRDEEERAILERVRPLIVHETEQDSNDLTKAVRYCWTQGISRVAIVGATGKREDHTLGNISLTMEYMRMGMEVRLLTDYGIFLPCRGDVMCHVAIPKDFCPASDKDALRTKSTQVSIFNFSSREFHTEGLRYPVAHLGNWWKGTLNEAVTSPFSIQADGEYLLFINYLK